MIIFRLSNSNYLNLKRFVIKIGSSVIAKDNKIDEKILDNIVSEASALTRRGKEIILVTSGAIATGKTITRLEGKNGLALQQAYAGIGQHILMGIYNKHAKKYKQKIIAQTLLTYPDLDSKKRSNYLKNTFQIYFQNKIIPIVNENDTIAVDEIKFGDNDTLSALVAKELNADLLLMLSNVNGLYKNYKTKNQKLVAIVEEITPSIGRLAKNEKNENGTGGMPSKLKAARLTTRAGIVTIVSNGIKYRIRDILKGKVNRTIFSPCIVKLKGLNR